MWAKVGRHDRLHERTSQRPNEVQWGFGNKGDALRSKVAATSRSNISKSIGIHDSVNQSAFIALCTNLYQDSAKKTTKIDSASHGPL